MHPFSAVTITDPNSGATDTLTITLSGVGGTLSGTGLINDGGGVYTLAAASATTITTEVEALAFTPTAGAPGTSSTTAFALSDLSSAYATATVNTTTTVIDTDPAAGADHLRNGGRTAHHLGSAGPSVLGGDDHRSQQRRHRYADHHAQRRWRNVERHRPHQRRRRRLHPGGGRRPRPSPRKSTPWLSRRPPAPRAPARPPPSRSAT